jgi:hypothetical protein
MRKSNPDTWIEHCRNQKTLLDAIHFAALSENTEGKRHPHQYRLRKENMKTLEANLLNDVTSIRKVKYFDKLFKIVEAAAPKGIGDLMIYDTAVRIGAFLQIIPDKIYLHAGTRIGLKKLVKNFTGDTINKNQLPEPLKSSNLTCFELEDLFAFIKMNYRSLKNG